VLKLPLCLQTADSLFRFHVILRAENISSGSQTYATPADAAQAGYEAIAAKRL
jgi:hypothetical protein